MSLARGEAFGEIAQLDKVVFQPVDNGRREYDRIIDSFKLIYQSYLSKGYVSAHSSGLYFNPYQLLSDTSVLNYISAARVSATMTLVCDQPDIGLPMDCLYRKELDNLRLAGRKIMECCAYASSLSVKIRPILLLQRMAILQSISRDFTDICIMVNPKHVEFYRRRYLSEPMGETKFHPGVQAPAVPLRLNLVRLAERLMQKSVTSKAPYYRELYSFLYGNENTECGLEYIDIVHVSRLSALDFRKILLHRKDIVRNLSPALRACLTQLDACLIEECCGPQDTQKVAHGRLYEQSGESTTRGAGPA